MQRRPFPTKINDAQQYIILLSNQDKSFYTEYQNINFPTSVAPSWAWASPTWACPTPRPPSLRTCGGWGWEGSASYTRDTGTYEASSCCRPDAAECRRRFLFRLSGSPGRLGTPGQPLSAGWYPPSLGYLWWGRWEGPSLGSQLLQSSLPWALLPRHLQSVPAFYNFNFNFYIQIVDFPRFNIFKSNFKQ